MPAVLAPRYYVNQWFDMYTHNFAYTGVRATGRPDADGLRASARAKDKLGTLSAERVWSELKKLLPR